MKAIVFFEYGGPDVLRYVDVETPVPADDQILVKVRAAAVNPMDWHLMRGTPFPLRFGSGLRRPALAQRLGTDFSGTVEATGRSVTRCAVGDAIFGGARGSLAEYLVVSGTGVVAKKPENMTFEQAASMFLAGMTAVQALRDKAHVRPGHKVLINGASGGVGTLAVQFAKVLGAEVTGVQSTRNVDLVRSLGADHVIDYTKDDFTSSGERYDVVLDNVGNRSLSEIGRVMKPQGTLVPNGGGSPGDRSPLASILWMFVMRPFASYQIRFFVAKGAAADLQTLADLMQAGTVRPVIDRSYSLSEAAEAMRYLESGRVRGKVVITI